MNTIKKIELVICDFDNTLFDWFEYWYKSFGTLVHNLIEKTGVNEEQLLNSIRDVHRKHRTSEYNRLLDELDIIKEGKNDLEIVALYESVLPQYFEIRKTELRLYPNVLETLKTLKSKGIKVVIYTESQPIYSYHRLHTLGIADIVDTLYAPESHDQGSNNSLYYKFDIEVNTQEGSSKLIKLPKEDKKPNPKVLLDILKDNAVAADKAIFIGDSLMKDICMSNEAEVLSVLADYGVKHHKEEYDLLRKVSHWTNEDIEKEKMFLKDTCVPNYVISDFAELISIIENR